MNTIHITTSNYYSHITPKNKDFFSIEITHKELNKRCLIEGTNENEVRKQANIQIGAWKRSWNKKQSKLNKETFDIKPI